MAVKKDQVVLGDTYHLSFSCYKRNDSLKLNDKVAVEPLLAEVSLWNVIDQVWVPLDGDDEMTATVFPVANKIDYVIPEDALIVDGDYKAFVTVIFNIDSKEHRVTEVVPFRVRTRE